MSETRASKPTLRVVGSPSSAPASVAPTGGPRPLTHEETIQDLLKQSRRMALPLRKSFVQQAPGSDSGRQGPLSEFVTRHDERGLDAYLFIHALASAEPWTCTYPSETWARILDLEASCEPASAKAAVSKVLKRLDDRRLIARRRDGRRTEVKLLAEDGSGEPYTRPKKAVDGLWLNLPYAFWNDGFYTSLSLSAKAMLLIGCSLKPEFELPQERMPSWYGISADTAGRGLIELRGTGLLSTRDEYVKDHKSTTGWRQIQHHRLLPPFDLATRNAAAEKAGPRPRVAIADSALSASEVPTGTQ